MLVGSFRHTITNHNYRFTVLETNLSRAPRGFRWLSHEDLTALPLTTASKKALRTRARAVSE